MAPQPNVESKWRVWTAVLQGVPIGHLMAHLRNENRMRARKRRKCAYVELFWVLVEPAHRRCGAANALFEALLSECREGWAHAIEVRLHCMTSNPVALAWYEKLGFARGLLKKNYPEPGFDSWRMARPLR